jgi:hypothetical protein
MAVCHLRDVNSEHVNTLKRIAGVVRNAKPYEKTEGYMTKVGGRARAGDLLKTKNQVLLEDHLL